MLFMTFYPTYAEIINLAALFAGYKFKSVTSAKFAAFFARFVWHKTSVYTPLTKLAAPATKFPLAYAYNSTNYKTPLFSFSKLRSNPNKAAKSAWVILTNKFRGITSIRTKNFAVNWIYALFSSILRITVILAIFCLTVVIR